MQSGFTRLRGQLSGTDHQIRVIGNQHTATRGGNDFVAIKREYGNPAKGTAGLTFVAGTQRLGGVFQHGNAITFANREQCIHIGTLPV